MHVRVCEGSPGGGHGPVPAADRRQSTPGVLQVAALPFLSAAFQCLWALFSRMECSHWLGAALAECGPESVTSAVNVGLLCSSHSSNLSGLSSPLSAGEGGG